MLTEELTIVRIICGDGAVPMVGKQFRQRHCNVRQSLTSPSKPRISCPCGQEDKEGCFQVRYCLATLLFDQSD
jgi:hypothetical protein